MAFRVRSEKNIVFAAKPLIGVPVHAFWFAKVRPVQNARWPPQAAADTIRPPSCPICYILALRRIGELVAFAASEDAPAIDHRDTLAAPTGRAKEPVSFAADMAGCRRQVDGVAFVLPFTAAASVPIGQDHAPQFCPDVDRSDDLAMP